MRVMAPISHQVSVLRLGTRLSLTRIDHSPCTSRSAPGCRQCVSGPVPVGTGRDKPRHPGQFGPDGIDVALHDHRCLGGGQWLRCPLHQLRDRRRRRPAGEVRRLVGDHRLIGLDRLKAGDREAVDEVGRRAVAPLRRGSSELVVKGAGSGRGPASSRRVGLQICARRGGLGPGGQRLWVRGRRRLPPRRAARDRRAGLPA